MTEEKLKYNYNENWTPEPGGFAVLFDLPYLRDPYGEFDRPREVRNAIEYIERKSSARFLRNIAIIMGNFFFLWFVGGIIYIWLVIT